MTGSLLAAETTSAGATQLVIGALIGIAVIVVLITWAKLHPFLVADHRLRSPWAPSPVQNLDDAVTSFATGFGSTVAGVGALIALGAMFGQAARRLGRGRPDRRHHRRPVLAPRALPWAMAAVGAIIGLPMFFEIGLVLLMPVICWSRGAPDCR